MDARRLVLWVTLATITGCRRGGAGDPGCDWPPEPNAALALSGPARNEHLRIDTQTAEELAIRHADLNVAWC